MAMREHILWITLATLASTALAEPPTTKPVGIDGALNRGQQVADKAIAYLKTQQQKDGSWQTNARQPPAVTAMVMRIIAQDAKHGPASTEVKQALAWLLAIQKQDGGIYKDLLATYNTAICISALAGLNDPALKGPIEKAVTFLKANQWTDAIAGPDGQKIGEKHPNVGGWGYGGTKGRPDLSNTAVALEALSDAGLKPDDPAYKAALKFVSRLQNYSETNNAAWAGNDGGFIYAPGKHGEGDSSAGEYIGPDGKRMLRSYGSMTYAGLKSMIYAGLAKDDPRVKAAWAWITKRWTLDENPGMAAAGPDSAKAGIYYYYCTLAKGLAVNGEPVFSDQKNNRHDWRVELIAKLAAEQKPDGSFMGDRKWMEDNPVVATSLAMFALQDAMRDLGLARPK
jgi:squalene-hopene/tetraprenyl-beta-curcumene cyclase